MFKAFVYAFGIKTFLMIVIIQEIKSQSRETGVPVETDVVKEVAAAALYPGVVGILCIMAIVGVVGAKLMEKVWK